MSSNFSEHLLEGLSWSFGGKVFNSQAEFDGEIRQRQIEMYGEDIWKPDTIALSCAVIILIYEFWRGADQVTKTVEIAADNRESFSEGELLFKIHNLVTEDLSGMDRRFFQGLILKKPPMIPPKYWLDLGS